MKKHGILWFLIAFLLTLAGFLVYFAVVGPNMSTKAKLVSLPVNIIERVGIFDG